MKKTSPKREYKDYIIDIDDSINKTEKFVENFTFDEFKNDEKTIYAVIRAVEIIGEAVKNIPAKVKNEHKEIPWKKMIDMRNKLIHEYFGVNTEVLWRITKEDIPELKTKITELIKELKINNLI